MEKIIKYMALSSEVLAVAVLNYKDEGDLFDWACYIDSVKGINHDNEYQQVARTGSKQSERIAQVLFPNYGITKYRR